MILRERWGGWKREPFTSESRKHMSVLGEADAPYTWLTTTRPRMRMQGDLNVDIAGPIAEREGHGRAWWVPQSGLGKDRRDLSWYASYGGARIKEEGDGW
jgi:hypothetical protein